MEWAARVTTLGLEFALPPYLGSLADRQWKTGHWLTIIGAVLGFAAGMMHLMQLARVEQRPRSNGPRAQRGGADKGTETPE
jgi:F0F1-type ATP synthase assembly protein I